MYDLPVSPVFGVFTVLVQDSSTPEGENAIFWLKRESYDGVIASRVMMPVMCKYNPKGRHVSVADATKKHPIFSVEGELVPLKKNACILCDVVEWTYPYQGNSKTGGDKSLTK
ncbi:11302_t:CDS:1, partial [Gigaspora rosea]